MAWSTALASRAAIGKASSPQTKGGLTTFETTSAQLCLGIFLLYLATTIEPGKVLVHHLNSWSAPIRIVSATSKNKSFESRNTVFTFLFSASGGRESCIRKNPVKGQITKITAAKNQPFRVHTRRMSGSDNAQASSSHCPIR